jgi:hypothetical protein
VGQAGTIGSVHRKAGFPGAWVGCVRLGGAPQVTGGWQAACAACSSAAVRGVVAFRARDPPVRPRMLCIDAQREHPAGYGYVRFWGTTPTGALIASRLTQLTSSTSTLPKSRSGRASRTCSSLSSAPARAPLYGCTARPGVGSLLAACASLPSRCCSGSAPCRPTTACSSPTS